VAAVNYQHELPKAALRHNNPSPPPPAVRNLLNRSVLALPFLLLPSTPTVIDNARYNF